MVAMIVDVSGVRAAASLADVSQQVSVGQFFWLDIFGGDGPTRAAYLSALGMEAADIAWALRFGQAGRMHIGQEKLRAVTWMAQPAGNLVEIHLFCVRQNVVTVWTGDPAALDEIRQQFAERVCGFHKSFYQAAAILLQLVLGTLDHAVRNMDATFDDLRMRLDHDSRMVDYTLLTRRQQRVQSVAASFDRYSSAVRSAIVGVEAITGMDAAAAEELNDYSEQVEDVEEQLYERRRWLSDVMHDYATAIAQRQGEQINRLTLVSLIFLPVTALTGFFGMNFDWLNRAIASEESFFELGVILPAVCVIATMGWLARRGLIQLKGWRRGGTKPPAEYQDLGFWASNPLAAPSASVDLTAKPAKTPA